MPERQATVNRETKETKVSVTLSLDGSGNFQGTTGNGVLDHLLAQLARHGFMDLAITAQGDTQTGWHHTVEDVAITLGRAIREALGEGRGIRRMGHALVPLDEALALVAVDLSGRGHASLSTGLEGTIINDLPGDLVRHLLEAMAVEAGITLHARLLEGVNPHHKAEALFKAMARALADAVQRDARVGQEIPSTKGTIKG